MLITRQALFENAGDSFKYSFLALPVAPLLAADVEAGLKKYKKTLDKYDELNLKFIKTDDGTMGLTAAMSFEKGIKAPALADRMEYLMDRSLTQICAIKEAEFDARKAFMKKKPGKLAKADFEIMAEGLSQWAAKEQEGPEGSWGWVQGSDEHHREVAMHNYGDHLEILVKAGDITDANRDKVAEKLKDWVAGEKPKKAASAELVTYRGGPWVKVTYNYEGLSTKEIFETYRKCIDDFSDEFAVKAHKFAKKFG